MFRALVNRVGDVVGRNLRWVPVPGWMGIATGRAVDLARARFGLDLPLSHEPPWTVADGDVADGSRA